jgi:lipopolysaccharide export system permease protein
MGATIASRKLRGGIGLHLAFGVGLSALYIVFLQFSSTFSIKGSLDPVIGANIPNLVFAGIALWLIRRAPK